MAIEVPEPDSQIATSKKEDMSNAIAKAQLRDYQNVMVNWHVDFIELTYT